jgi:hypothetical protein
MIKTLRHTSSLLALTGLITGAAACAPAQSVMIHEAAAPAARASSPPTVLATGPGTMAVRVDVHPREATVLVEGRQVANPGVVILQSHPTRTFHIEATAPGYACTHAEMARGGFSAFQSRLQPVAPGQQPCSLGYYRDGLEDDAKPRTAAVDLSVPRS